MITTVNPELGKLPYPEFQAWHRKFFAHDTMTVRQRYESLGGKLPKEPVKEKPTEK
jgi:hypothetical protein